MGGEFADAGGVAAADHLALTSIGPWFPIGSNGAGDGIFFDGQGVFAMAMMGNELYVAGSFTNAAGILTADRIAKWDGATWSGLGSDGTGNGAINGTEIRALAVMGDRLIVAGSFSVMGLSEQVNALAQWDGSRWSAVGGLAGPNPVTATITAVAVVGGDLYIAGGFTDLAGIDAADTIAHWNGTTWSALGLTAPLNGGVQALAADGGSVYVGGTFTNAGGIPAADYVARWDGTSWSALGSNGAGGGAITGNVRAITVVNGAVYVGGDFLDAAGNPDADRIARWVGAAWSALGPGNSAGTMPGRWLKQTTWPRLVRCRPCPTRRHRSCSSPRPLCSRRSRSAKP